MAAKEFCYQVVALVNQASNKGRHPPVQLLGKLLRVIQGPLFNGLLEQAVDFGDVGHTHVGID